MPRIGVFPDESAHVYVLAEWPLVSSLRWVFWIGRLGSLLQSHNGLGGLGAAARLPICAAPPACSPHALVASYQDVPALLSAIQELCPAMHSDPVMQHSFAARCAVMRCLLIFPMPADYFLLCVLIVSAPLC